MLKFWKRDRIAHGLVAESEVDLQALCIAARQVVERLPAMTSEIGELREDNAILQREYEREVRKAQSLEAANKLHAETNARLTAKLDEAQASHARADDAASSLRTQYEQSELKLAAALAEVKRLRSAYEDVFGGLAVMMDVAFGVVETFPDEPQPEPEPDELRKALREPEPNPDASP